MNENNTDFARPKTSYRKLRVFLKAEAIYDLTYLFLQRNISRSDRTYDQMLQAARSGKQNIVEGRSDAGASAEMEIKLYGVAYGSLHELLNDYEDFMRTRNIPRWTVSHPRASRLREICQSQNDTSYFMAFAARLNNEELCNLLITLIYQTLTMLSKLIELVKQDFLKNGGIKEQIYRARISARDNNFNRG
ncbi:MAG: four helix bundle suffix domain-containing protein [Muribaculaceae bacterium]|nr:four helix bundle suffix domain-containing protein [Muribaculaceae bacterium]